MGLTSSSTGAKARDRGPGYIPAKARSVVLAGNPNVGKSTLFNALTGLRQHTGNWPGKTVSSARGVYTHRGEEYCITDTPGAYSLSALSQEEEVARDVILFTGADVTVAVCDAARLQRNLNLVLQILEITPRTVVALNLMDEAGKNGITVDSEKLSALLGVPVIKTTARSRRGLSELREAVSEMCREPTGRAAKCVRFSEAVERACALVEMPLFNLLNGAVSERWAALRLLSGDDSAIRSMNAHLGYEPAEHPTVAPALEAALRLLTAAGYTQETLRDHIITAINEEAREIADACLTETPGGRSLRQLRTDRLLTRRATGLPIMLLLLALVFYITIRAANYPSALLASALQWLGDAISRALCAMGTPGYIHDPLIFGVWRVLSWVVAVMLPPMAIFFPLFTILEDLGYLPRVAFNLDNSFRSAGACGKQSLTMCMGFGCNAAGVTGCRIIESPRERLIAIVTNSLVPCNGRFPMLISLCGIFFICLTGKNDSLASALMLTGLILIGVLATLAASLLLSKTVMRGVPSALTLELPPYRLPKVGDVIYRSVLDRTLFVLGRAAAVAAPAGLFIWLAANVTVGGVTPLEALTNILDPLGRALGMDGVILAAFLLGLPANETVLPIMLMAYLRGTSVTGCEDLGFMTRVLTENGWTWSTCLCTALFALFHWPCSTTILTVKKESGSLRWTALAVILPTFLGAVLCFIVNLLLGALFQ